MIRILLACEGGSGLGHVDSLKMFARALGPRFVFDGVHFNADALAALAEVCDASFAGPAFMPSMARASPGTHLDNWSWGNFLERCGLGIIPGFAASVNWWRQTLRGRETDLVIADYAPQALLAARMLGIPVVLTGTAYSVPPNGLTRFPPYLDMQAVSAVDEASMTHNLNAFGGIRGLPHLRNLPDLFDCVVKLPQGLSFLDPYEGLRTEPLLPRPFTFSKSLGGSGDEIYVYLSHVVADPDFMLDALTALGRPVRAFIPWLSPEKVAKLRASGVMVEERLVHPDDIARRSRLMVLYGQPGTMALGLAAGIPQLALPQHFEQKVHAKRAAAKGGVRVVDRDGLTRERFIAAVQEAYVDQNLFVAAQRIAPDLRREMNVDVPNMIQESLRPTLVEIIKRKGLA